MLGCAYQPIMKLIGPQYLSLLILSKKKDMTSHNIDAFENMLIVSFSLFSLLKYLPILLY